MNLPEVSSICQLENDFPLFVRKRERVLLCFPGREEPVGRAIAEYVERCGAIPVFWGTDLRWITLLRKGFQDRCSTVVGSPQIVLGLSKLARRAGIPLYIRNAVLLGDTPDEWITRNIQIGFDCVVRSWVPGKAEPAALDENIAGLLRELRRWTTILDLKLENLGPGLSLELVTFPGEKLPKLPSFARLVVRDWSGENDVPFDVPLQWKAGIFSSNNH